MEVEALLHTIDEKDVETGKANSEALFSKLAQMMTYLKKNGTDILGLVIHAAWTEAEYSVEKGYDLLDGLGDPIPDNQKSWVKITTTPIDITGSDYANKKGISTIAACPSGSALIMTDTDGNILTASTGEVKSHSHRIMVGQNGSGTTKVIGTPDVSGNGFDSEIYASTNGFSGQYIENTGGANNLAAGLKVNMFLKINY